MKRRDDERQIEEDAKYPPSFLEDVRQRNRLDRLRRACRDQVSAAAADCDVQHLDHGHLDPVLVEQDPLPYGNVFK